MSDNIVITGMGILSPIGCGEAAFWDALCRGQSGAKTVTSLDTSELNRQIACQIDEPIGEDASMGRASQLAVSAAREAISSAGLNATDLQNQRVSVIVGTTMGETGFIEERIDVPPEDWLSAEHMNKIMSAKPGSISQNVLSAIVRPHPHGRGSKNIPLPHGRGSEKRPLPHGRGSENISLPQGRGSAVDLYGACAAGNMAIETARRQLLDGRCDLAIVGGADGFSILAFIGFMRLRVMASQVCRPFDDQRDGLLVGEGAAIFVLERESSANARGVSIRARVLGGAITSENYHPTRPHPDGDGLCRAINNAMQDAGVSKKDIDYACAHGTGTPQNDAIEMKVMQQCLHEGTPFSSVKALTGHTMGAASAIEAAACILSMQHQTLFPTWQLENVLQPCSMDALKDQTRSARLKCVINNSAGFGGYNSSIVLGAA